MGLVDIGSDGSLVLQKMHQDKLELMQAENNKYYSAAGAGGGIRVHLPTLNMSICGDVGIPIHGNNDSSSPTIHGYINLPF